MISLNKQNLYIFLILAHKSKKYLPSNIIPTSCFYV